MGSQFWRFNPLQICRFGPVGGGVVLLLGHSRYLLVPTTGALEAHDISEVILAFSDGPVSVLISYPRFGISYFSKDLWFLLMPLSDFFCLLCDPG